MSEWEEGPGALAGQPWRPRAEFTSRPDAVDVWSLRLAHAAVAADEALLSEDERERALRLVSGVRRAAFVSSRAALRRVLSIHTGTPPGHLRFRTAPAGKPSLEGADAPQFSLAHAQDRGLVAVAWGVPVGVDLEPLVEEREMVAMARTIFTPEEQRALAAVAGAERVALFHRVWTRKEAWLKARGSGFTFPANEVSVSTGPGEPRVLRLPAGEPYRAALSDLPLGRGWAAALCLGGPPRPIRLWAGASP